MSTNSLNPVQFSRLTRRGLLLGLTLPQLIVLGFGLATLVGALYLVGSPGVAWTSPVWVGSAVVALVPVGGRQMIGWVPILGRWVSRASRGQLMFRRRLIRPRPAGTLALPGDAASLRE